MNQNNINWTTLTPGLISAGKLIAQSFGYDIPDEKINAVVNGAAAVIAIITIFMSHRKPVVQTQQPNSKNFIQG